MAERVTQTQRTATPQRWQKALERAISNGLEVFTVSDTGERMVTSASQLDVLYRTDGRSCTCAAALGGDQVCQHRAVVRFVLGQLTLESHAVPTLVNCAACNGCGSVYSNNGGWKCDFCSGRGQVTVTPAPAVMPVSRSAAVAAA